MLDHFTNTEILLTFSELPLLFSYFVWMLIEKRGKNEHWKEEYFHHVEIILWTIFRYLLIEKYIRQ